jgi:hypothetical protein
MALTARPDWRPDLDDDTCVLWKMQDEQGGMVVCFAFNSFVQHLAIKNGHPDQANPSKADRDKLFRMMLSVLEEFASSRHDRVGTPSNRRLEFYLDDARIGP